MYRVYRFNHESRLDMKTILKTQNIIINNYHISNKYHILKEKKTNDTNLKPQLLWFETKKNASL